MKKKNDWIDLAPLDAVPRRGARCVKAPGGRIAVFRTEDDRIFATEDKCPHAGGPLSQGIVHGRSVTCPLHSWKVRLEDGRRAIEDDGIAQRLAALKADTIAIRAMIKKLITDENPQKPLSDSKIAQLLGKESSIQVARRTVAKYREAMSIPSSTDRKRLA